MFAALPMRHRTALAVGLYLVALVTGTWTSTLVGDPGPTAWGVALGGLAGLGLALRVVLLNLTAPRRAGSRARR
jgi:hypothetical protein